MENKVEISSEDIKFLENENINLDELLENAIQHKKREWRQNNPIPNIPKSVLKSIENIHKDYNINSLSAFNEGIPRAKLSIGARVLNNEYEITVRINRLQDIPDGISNTKLSNSGDFLAEINKQLNTKLKELNNSNEDYVFYLDDITEDEFKKSVKYKATITP
jgi:bifunctional N-acetylglucosamine-1-phosphate-uridyltransferase/glucosamine-1-phosphate-acetyltransferase GlmU-like protein